MTHAVHLLHVTKFVNVQILELPKLDRALKFLVNFGNFQISMHMLSKFVCLQIWQFAKNVHIQIWQCAKNVCTNLEVAKIYNDF